MSIESRFRKGDILASDSHHTIVIYSHTTRDTGALFFLAALIHDGDMAYTSSGVGYTTYYKPAKESEKVEMIERLKEEKVKLIYPDSSALDSLVIIDTFNSVLSDNYSLEILDSGENKMNVEVTTSSYDLFKNSTKLFKDIKPCSITSINTAARFGGNYHLQLYEIFEIDL